MTDRYVYTCETCGVAIVDGPNPPQDRDCPVCAFKAGLPDQPDHWIREGRVR